jgi:diazepam-binding inhibitor (GABA receptor modulating acyl-CoA-binding protein)
MCLPAALSQLFALAAKVTDAIPRTSAADFPSNEQRYVFYGLYKQALMGPQREPKPAGNDQIAKWKWNAWNDQGNKSRHVAMQEYIVAIHEMLHGLDLSQLPSHVRVLVSQFLNRPASLGSDDAGNAAAAAKLDAGTIAVVPSTLTPAKTAPKSSFASALDAVAGPGAAPVGGVVPGAAAAAPPQPAAVARAVSSTFAVPASKATPAKVTRATGTRCYARFTYGSCLSWFIATVCLSALAIVQ